MSNCMVEMRGEKRLGTETWFVAKDYNAISSWRSVVYTIHTALTYYFRSRIAILLFPIFEMPESGKIFNNIYLIPPKELPDSIDVAFMVNQAFIEDFFDSELSAIEQCKSIFGLSDPDYLRDKWMTKRAVFVGIYTELQEGNDGT